MASNYNSAYNAPKESPKPTPKQQPEQHHENKVKLCLLNKPNPIELSLKPKIQFDSIVHIKPGTVTKGEIVETIVQDEYEIKSLKTRNDIIEHTDKLMNELEKLEKMKEEHYDKLALREMHEQLKYKFKLLNEAKVRILGDENAKKPMPSKNVAENVVGAAASVLVNKIGEKNKTREIEIIHFPPKKNTIDEILLKNDKPLKFQRSISSSSSVFQYLSNLCSKCDVVIVFHCCIYISQFFLSKITRLFTNEPKIRIAVIYCELPQIYKASEFLSESDSMSSIKYTTIRTSDIRNHIISMDWNKSASLKIVCHVAACYCRHQKYQEIIKPDSVQELMDFNKIISHLNFIDSLSNDQMAIRSVFDFVDSKHFANLINMKIKQSMTIQLYYLKRMSSSTYDEIIKQLKSQHSVKYPLINDKSSVNILKLRKTLCFDDLTRLNLKMNDFETIETNLTLCIKEKNKQSSYSHKVHEGILHNANDKKKLDEIWIEVFPNEETYFIAMNIHHTALFFSEKFNEYLKKQQIKVSTPYLLESKDSSLMFGQFKYISNQQPDLLFRMNGVMQAFMHLTYTFSKEQIIVIDLRTFDKDSSCLLLTEPIVFCTTERNYGPSNLGAEAINYLMSNHVCNQLCESLTPIPKKKDSAVPTSGCNLM